MDSLFYIQEKKNIFFCSAAQAERDKKLEDERRQELQRKIKDAQRREKQKEEDSKRREQASRVRDICMYLRT